MKWQRQQQSAARRKRKREKSHQQGACAGNVAGRRRFLSFRAVHQQGMFGLLRGKKIKSYQRIRANKTQQQRKKQNSKLFLVFIKKPGQNVREQENVGTACYLLDGLAMTRQQHTPTALANHSQIIPCVSVMTLSPWKRARRTGVPHLEWDYVTRPAS